MRSIDQWKQWRLTTCDPWQSSSHQLSQAKDQHMIAPSWNHIDPRGMLLAFWNRIPVVDVRSSPNFGQHTGKWDAAVAARCGIAHSVVGYYGKRVTRNSSIGLLNCERQDKHTYSSHRPQCQIKCLKNPPGLLGDWYAWTEKDPRIHWYVHTYPCLFENWAFRPRKYRNGHTYLHGSGAFWNLNALPKTELFENAPGIRSGYFENEGFGSGSFLACEHRGLFFHCFQLACPSDEYSALPILCVRYFWWERERERYREREIDGSDVTIVALKLAMNLHFPLPKIRTIGDELTFSLAKNSHFSFLRSHFPCLPSRKGHRYHGGAEIRNEFTLSIAIHTFHCQKNFRPQALFPLFQTSRATSDRKPKTNDQVLPSPMFFPSKNWIKLIPKTIGNRKRDCAWGSSGW